MEEKYFQERAEEIWEAVMNGKSTLPKKDLIEAISSHLNQIVIDYKNAQNFPSGENLSYKEEISILFEQVYKHLIEAEQYTQASYHCAADIANTDSNFTALKKDLISLGKSIRNSVGDLISLKNSYFIK